MFLINVFTLRNYTWTFSFLQFVICSLKEWFHLMIVYSLDACLKGRPMLDERCSLPRLRKLVLLHVPAHRTDDILMNILHWQMLDSLFLQYDDDEEWSLALIDGLKGHRYLRHLCFIVESEPSKSSAWGLPKREMIEELVEAWANRDWMSIFFLKHARFQEMPRSSIISAIHHGDGNVKYKEIRDVSIDKVILAFPQFYTLFWQYLTASLYP